jgi:hypothetical protein
MNKQISVYDNFLDIQYYHSLFKTLYEESEFDWYLNRSIDHDTDFLDCCKIQFTHHFFKETTGPTDSPFLHLIDPIIKKLKPKKISRIKANLLPYTENLRINTFHIDGNNHTKTAIYYINTNNGYTIFEDDTKINSLANRMIIFDSLLYHTGTTCTDDKCRIVINFNFD